MLTAMGKIEDGVLDLDAGADDYLVKPFAKASHAFAAGNHSVRAEIGQRNDKFDELAASLNAISATNRSLAKPAGTRIELGAPVDTGHSAVFVRDNGDGIAQQDRKRALERFARLELHDAMPGLDARIVFGKHSQ